MKRGSGPEAWKERPGAVTANGRRDAQNLLDRAPQFGELAKAAAGQASKPSSSQQKFLDDFAQRLAEDMAEGDDASAEMADVDGRGKESHGS